MRRADILEVLDRVPMPDVSFGMHLIDILFRVGPVKSETALTEGDLEPWERRRGIELAPWQAELLVDLSQAYLMEMHNARSPSAVPPWPPAERMWRYVKDRLAEQAMDREAREPKENPSNGSRQRHRNPPTR